MLTVKTVTKDARSSKVIAINYGTTFNRKARPVKEIMRDDSSKVVYDTFFDASIFQNAPDHERRERIPDNNAALYRLSGDLNPLHIDTSLLNLRDSKDPSCMDFVRLDMQPGMSSKSMPRMAP